MIKKRRKEPPSKPSLSRCLGIPAFSLAEKKTVVVPIKCQPSLKKALKQATDNVSEFGRRALIEKLQRMTEESS